MKLFELISDLKVIHVSGSLNIEIAGLAEDSRSIFPGFIFFARQGEKTSGLNYMAEAIKKGAQAIISETLIDRTDATFIQVSSVSQAESKIASKFYGFPSRELTVVGVTGTNGKTTFTYLLESMARAIGWRVGVIGTINYRLPKADSEEMEVLPAPNTTPNPLELHRILKLMHERKTDLVVMEVSSHALALGRVDSIEFDGAIFTNLTQDHLDFHKTMENYFLAKAKLFQMISPQAKTQISSQKVQTNKFCIINVDDPYGQRMATFCRIPVKTYAIKRTADLMAEEIFLSACGSRFFLAGAKKKLPVELPLIGEHNIYNSLSAASAALELGIPLEIIVDSLKKVPPIPGRLEPVDCGQGFTVLVDYAHTEDALKNVLQSLKPIAKKRILTLFGCGGDRDRSKRPRMGQVAATLSDWVIITSDNPRSEDPARIALDIELGIQRLGKKNYEVILDREAAIRKILKISEKGDMVLIAGKGHETYQIFKDSTIEFDDCKIVRKILSL